MSACFCVGGPNCCKNRRDTVKASQIWQNYSFAIDDVVPIYDDEIPQVTSFDLDGVHEQ